MLVNLGSTLCSTDLISSSEQSLLGYKSKSNVNAQVNLTNIRAKKKKEVNTKFFITLLYFSN